MEAKELMIGDWVSSPYGNIQVEFIYNNGYDDVVGEHEEMYLDWDTGEEDLRMKDITIEMIDPIPLTEDILLQNGFERYEGRYRLITPDDSIFVEHIITESNDFFWFTNTSRVFRQIKPSIVCNFNYVHEFQHLLRLCGLNDLADNFKIE